MRLFGSSGRKPGWLCINLMPDRVDVCHVNAAGRERPEILLCDSYRKESDDEATLARLRRELGLDRYRCTTLLRGGDYQMLQVEAPANVPAGEAKNAVRWRVKDMIDYPVDAATVDAVFIPAAEGAAARAPQMLAVAAKNQTIAAAVKSFNDADIPLEAIDIPELAQRNLARCLEPEGRGLALLAFDDAGGLLTFTSGGELYQSRRIEVSAANFTGAGPEQRQGLYDRVVLELQRSLDNFDRQFRHVAVAKVIVTPVPGADDLREYLAANLDVPVAAIHLSEIMDFPHIPELHEDARQAQCLQMIGAAMREEAAA
ncbi:MAG: agglutinin biogenesis protein MshI [Betaproteobacteria bacterium]|nr:agglutinin biogenesis protein MshI [Betaproteobacteria bacterium]